ncbi:MAG: hypothetical protein WC389_05545 [Lutibacter sp.]|jgi:RNA polymerase sporulation-specific sigma factor
MAIANKKEILNELNSIDLQGLMDRMELYVRNRFYSNSEREKKGFDYLDFCDNVILKACDGTRNWDKDKCSFDEFIFGSLKSDLFNYFRKVNEDKEKLKSGIVVDDVEKEVYIIDINNYVEPDEMGSLEIPSTIDFETISKIIIEDLNNQGADKLEIEIFECWLNGYYKPKEIAELCDASVTQINIAVKRLSRKTLKLKEKWTSLKK